MKALLDDTLRSLLGRRIIDVRYAAIDYFDGRPYWDSGQIHEMEQGVEFSTDDNEVFRISWDGYKTVYGLNIALRKTKPFWEAAVLWNVTERAEWQPLVNQEIKEIKTYWHGDNDDFSLQDLEFNFNGNTVWFSASRYDQQEDRILRGMDDLSVIFEEPIAFKYKIGNYTSEKELKIEIFK